MAEEAQQAKGRGGQYLLTLVFVVIGFVIGAYIDAIAPWLRDDLGLRLWHLLFLPLWFFVSIMVHEGGHFLAGRLAGLQWMTVTAGPLRLTRLHGGHSPEHSRSRVRPRIKVQWFTNNTSIGGLVLMVPGVKPTSRAGWACFVLGGPVANLLLSAVLVVIMRAGAAPLWQGPLLLLALVSLFLGALNLLPFRASGFSTDGRNLLDILRGDAAYAVSRAMLAIAGHSVAGVRPRDWDRALVAQIREAQMQSRDQSEAGDEESQAARAARAYTLYLEALDAGDRQRMQRHLAETEDYFEALPSLVASPVACALAIHFRLIDRNLAAADAWHEKGQAGLTDASMLALADFSRAHVRGDMAEARRLADHARRCMAEDADQGGVQPYRDLLEQIMAADSAAGNALSVLS
ncbi:MAG: M50 family metallopeptidase [Alcanivorax sp.]|nr:M50 family metallopeptidase [Alcanivorax sp.]